MKTDVVIPLRAGLFNFSMLQIVSSCLFEFIVYFIFVNSFGGFFFFFYNYSTRYRLLCNTIDKNKNKAILTEIVM